MARGMEILRHERVNCSINSQQILCTKEGDKVAQLVRCRTSNQRVAGSIPGRPRHFGLFLGKAVYSKLLQSTQLQNGYLA